MAVFSEDVIIRLLVDSSDAVKDIRKTNAELAKMGGQAKLSAAEMGKLAASTFGVSTAVDLLVKGITTQVQEIRESEKAYVDAAKAQGDATTRGIEAYDALNEAEEQQRQIRGRNHNENMAWWRERRAASIAENAAYRNLNTEQRQALADLNVLRRRQGEDTLTAVEYTAQLETQYESLTLSLDNYVSAEEALRIAKENQLRVEAEQEAARERYRIASEKAEITLRNLRFATEQVGLEGVELLEVQRAQAIELVLLNEYYKDNRDAVIEATNALFDARIEQVKMNERRREAIKDLNEYNAIVANIFDDADAPPDPFASWNDSIDILIGSLNALGSVVSGLLTSAFDDNKEAAIANAIINQALALTNLYANLPLPAALIATPFVIATTAKQIQKIQAESFKAALGTPPGGYTVPPGFDGDTFPVMAQSGETVTVTPRGEDSGATLDLTLVLDSSVLARIVNQEIRNRKVVIRTSDLVA